MSVEQMKRAIAFQPTNRRAKPLLIVLAWRADDHGESYAGLQQLSKDSGLSVRTIQRYRNALVDDGVLVVTHRTDECGDPTSNLYRLRLPEAIAKPKAKTKPPGQRVTTPLVSVSPPPGHSGHLKKEERSMERLSITRVGMDESVVIGADNPPPDTALVKLWRRSSYPFLVMDGPLSMVHPSEMAMFIEAGWLTRNGEQVHITPLGHAAGGREPTDKQREAA